MQQGCKHLLALLALSYAQSISITDDPFPNFVHRQAQLQEWKTEIAPHHEKNL